MSKRLEDMPIKVTHEDKPLEAAYDTAVDALKQIATEIVGDGVEHARRVLEELGEPWVS